jgi:hypothetical protein
LGVPLLLLFLCSLGKVGMLGGIYLRCWIVAVLRTLESLFIALMPSAKMILCLRLWLSIAFGK